MKKKVKLIQIGQRTKAKSDNEIIKTVPKPFQDLVNELGFIDVRTDKMTMSGEERLLLILYKETEEFKDIPNFIGLENIEILHKNFINMRYGTDYYTVSIKNGPEIRIKYSDYEKIDFEEKEIKRWA